VICEPCDSSPPVIVGHLQKEQFIELSWPFMRASPGIFCGYVGYDSGVRRGDEEVAEDFLAREEGNMSRAARSRSAVAAVA